MKKVPIKDLLLCDLSVDDLTDIRKYGVSPEEHMDFVAEEYLETEHYTSVVLVVVRLNGEIVGFMDTVNSEGERELNQEYKSIDSKIQIYAVTTEQVTKYKRVD